MASRFLAAVAGGAAGAAALTILHEALKRTTPDAPRVDRAAKQGLRNAIRGAGGTPPSEERLHGMALAGDLVSNTAYYSVALGFGPRAAKWLGPLLGVGAGLGAVVLPEKVGIDSGHTARTSQTAMLAIGLYLAGGVVATAVYRALYKEARVHERKAHKREWALAGR